MARRVFLHIGTMKAATTYLQKLFDRNNDLLAQHDILWLGSSRNMQAVFDLRGSGQLLPENRGGWRDFRDEIHRWPDDALVSVELLAKIPVRAIERLALELEPAELRVILTARDLTRTIPSHWQETTQNRRTTPWEQYAAEVSAHDPTDRADPNSFWKNHHLPSLIRAWSTIVPPDRISLVTVPKPGAAPDVVWQRFSEVIGVPPDGFTPPGFNNAALGATSAELMRRVNQEVAHLDWQHYRYGFKSGLAKRTLALRAGEEPRPTLTTKQYQRVRERVETMLAEVTEQNVQVVGDLDDLLPAAEPPASAGTPAQPTDTDLLDAAIAGLAGLGERAADMRVERDALRRRVRALEANAARRPSQRPATMLAKVRSRAARALRSLRRTGRLRGS